MVEDKAVETGASEQRDLTVVTVPEEKVQAVLDFIASLDSEEAEVSGFMMSVAISLAGRPLAAVGKHATGTGCLSSPTGWKCSDVDRQPGDE